jgi:hypothetical protein
MNRFSNDKDLLFSAAGDFVLDSKRHDLADTANLSLRALVQRVMTQCLSNPGDWVLQSSVGSGVSGFAGRPNTAITGADVAAAIRGALVRPDLLRSQEVAIDVFPMNENQIAIVVAVTPIGETAPLQLNFSYDFKDNKLVSRNY